MGGPTALRGLRATARTGWHASGDGRVGENDEVVIERKLAPRP